MLNEVPMTNEELQQGIAELIARNNELEDTLGRVKEQLEVYKKALLFNEFFDRRTRGPQREKGTALQQTVGMRRACKGVLEQIGMAISQAEFWHENGPFEPKEWERHE